MAIPTEGYSDLQRMKIEDGLKVATGARNDL
jgi:hypothetical protein